MHTYIHTYIHACMHACIHTYIHTYIQTKKGKNENCKVKFFKDVICASDTALSFPSLSGHLEGVASTEHMGVFPGFVPARWVTVPRSHSIIIQVSCPAGKLVASCL